MKKTVDTISASRQRKAKRRYFGAVLALTLCAALTCPALAAGSDPLTIVNNLSDFIWIIHYLDIIIKVKPIKVCSFSYFYDIINPIKIST